MRTNDSHWHCPYSASAGQPIRVGLEPSLPRPRIPTLSNTPARVSQSSTTLKFVVLSDWCLYRGLIIVLADGKEMENVLLQACRRKRTVV